MRKWISLLCAACVAAAIPGALWLHSRLPVDVQPLIEAKYGGWSGVLRLWVCEGWASGRCAGWLNRCIAAYEKSRPGVYVQPQYVDTDAIASLDESGIAPPDLVLMPPGTGADARWFIPLASDPRLREGLPGSIGEPRALPVMLGGYLWALNAERLPDLPGSWREVGTTLSVPTDEPFRRWSCALMGLCACRYAPEGGGQSELSGELELGLSGEATPAPAPTQPPMNAGLPCRLPENFAPMEDAFAAFARGELDAVPVTQREIRRLRALDEQGKGIDWRLAASGEAFTDQVLYLGIIDPASLSEEVPDGPARRELCLDFLRHLLSDECQGMLHLAGACSVTGALSGYAPGAAEAQMEAALRSGMPAVPGCFDRTWVQAVEPIVRKFLLGEGDAADLWPSVRARLQQNPEHCSVP